MRIPDEVVMGLYNMKKRGIPFDEAVKSISKKYHYLKKVKNETLRYMYEHGYTLVDRSNKRLNEFIEELPYAAAAVFPRNRDFLTEGELIHLLFEKYGVTVERETLLNKVSDLEERLGEDAPIHVVDYGTVRTYRLSNWVREALNDL